MALKDYNSEETRLIEVIVEKIKVIKPAKLAVLKSEYRQAPCHVNVEDVAALLRLFSLPEAPCKGGTGRYIVVEPKTIRILVEGQKSEIRNRRGDLQFTAIKILLDEEEDDLEEPVPDVNYTELNHKSIRHELFAAWIAQTYPCVETIMDVAGGNGLLSQGLLDRGYKVILVDPNPRCQNVTIVAEPLYGNGSDLLEKYSDLRSVDLIVGMHPDQATEPIVETAENLGVPFCLVPCCVFPNLNPTRQQPNGDPVRSYTRFCQYLTDLGDYRVDYLDFKGRNKVIYKP